MRKKKNSLKERLVGLAVVLVIGYGWFALRQALASPEENKVEAESLQKETTKSLTENVAKENDAVWYSAVDEAYMVPVSKQREASGQRLNRYAYIASYNAETRNPDWVAWTLTAAHIDGDNARGGHKFVEDLDVPAPRATYCDIREGECGYQRGHMCPAGDNKWSYKAQKEAFLMTNICPQNGDLNQRDWKYLEEACRDWALKYGKVYIVAGPIFKAKTWRTVGENHVAVPDAFFKVVLTLGKNQDSPKAIGFIYLNEKGRHQMEYYARSVDEVEAVTGLDFFSHLDDSVERVIESRCDLRNW